MYYFNVTSSNGPARSQVTAVTRRHLYSAQVTAVTRQHPYSARVTAVTRRHPYSAQVTAVTRRHLYSAQVTAVTRQHLYSAQVTAVTRLHLPQATLNQRNLQGTAAQVWSVTGHILVRLLPFAAHVSIRQHTSAYVSIRQHTSAYVSKRQAEARQTRGEVGASERGNLHMIHSIFFWGGGHKWRVGAAALLFRGIGGSAEVEGLVRDEPCGLAYVSIRQQTSAWAYVGIHQVAGQRWREA
jgi:hypothetical protein